MYVSVFVCSAWVRVEPSRLCTSQLPCPVSRTCPVSSSGDAKQHSRCMTFTSTAAAPRPTWWMTETFAKSPKVRLQINARVLKDEMVCVCVCVRESEREGESFMGLQFSCSQASLWMVVLGSASCSILPWTLDNSTSTMAGRCQI